MKYFYHLLIVCLIVIACLFWIDSTTRYRDFIEKVEAESLTRDIRIEQLEKEVRLLKTDLDIKENGFSEE